LRHETALLLYNLFVMGDGVPCYGALEIVGLLLLLLLQNTKSHCNELATYGNEQPVHTLTLLSHSL